jgi:hypothetical protein
MQMNFRQRNLPYLLRRVEGTDLWVPLNREYKPIGTDKADRHYTPLEALENGKTAFKLTKSKEAKLRHLCKGNSDYENEMYLYNDGCQPEYDWAHYNQLLKNLMPLDCINNSPQQTQ